MIAHSAAYALTNHVAIDGDDISGNGSAATPWATITHALDNSPDGAVIEVHPGTYSGRIRIRGTFPSGIVVRSQVPYQAKLRHTGTVITAYTHPSGVNGITLEGFDIAHSGSGAAALLVHIDGNGNNSVNQITLKNNILHDSYNNDILKINNACTDIVVSGNMFYNQTGSDEHIDLNSVSDVTVQDNIFFNDFEGSGRSNQNNTSSFIVIKDSNGSSDQFTGSRNVDVKRNVFLNWQGSTGSNFILVGEDGQPFYEAFDVLVQNNLLLGNSDNVMRAPFGVKGGRDITFRNNTISGDLPALAYAMRLNREGNNPTNQNIQFYNNVWSDQTGTMGATGPGNSNDFSDTPIAQTSSFVLSNNAYWNGGASIPQSASELINFTDDNSRLTVDPRLPAPESIVLPRWLENNKRFADGSLSIRAAFVKLVHYAIPAVGSPLFNRADSGHMPSNDILGRKRLAASALGAYEPRSAPPGVNPAGNTPVAPALLLLLL